MTEVPKIVYERLRAAALEHAASAPIHPDADLLTAFVEQTLSAAERDRILEHAAVCTDCREVVALSLRDEDTAADPMVAEAAVRVPVSQGATPAPRKAFFAWRSLRWAALAAGIAVAATMLLLHPAKRNIATLPSSAPPVAVATPPGSAQPMATSLADQPGAMAQNDEAKQRSELQSLRKKTVTPALRKESATLLADNQQSSPAANTFSPAAAGASALDSSGSYESSKTIEAAGVSVAVSSESAVVEPGIKDKVMATNQSPAIEKAKPAPQTVDANENDGDNDNDAKATQGGAVAGSLRQPSRSFMSAAKLGSAADATLARNVTWTIAAGILQRSLDGGQSWQNALRADHPLLCYARRSRDQEVWTGGQAGTLFHSSDGGATWVLVQPSVKEQRLRADVTHIALGGDDLRGDLRDGVPSAAEIVISTSTREVWSSSDGGKTWSLAER